MSWTQAELDALRAAYAAGTLRVTWEGRTVEYGSAEDLLARIRTLERALQPASDPLPLAGLAGFRRSTS